MANTKQAKKRAAQSVRRRNRNRSVVSKVRSTLKKLRAEVEAKTEKAGEMVSTVASQLDKAVRKGVLHRRTAGRLKSRTAKAANKAKKATAK
ncbi:MAG TPA: 30S ribosomal protein S20 [Thermoanaerobaculia bacterium]|jgi:small subunit ribosomal protein S20|nr:30S ribosomal protein S20 [Thermoanaerobaculia bacterium]